VFEPHQVVHRNQILATGVTGRELTELVHLGVVTRLWRGWYTTGQTIALPDPRGVTRSMRVVLSHQSAAAWYGVDLLEPVDRLHVTAPRNRGRRAFDAPGVRLHRRDVASAEIRWERGIRVTAPNRTVADLARTLATAPAVAVADGFLRCGLTTTASLIASAEALPQGFGRPAVRRVASLADGRSGSVFESLTRVLLYDAGLPRPRLQLNVRDPRGLWIARVDFAWPEARVILECDGFEFHSDRASFERDRRRWSALTRAGWHVVAVTWSQVVSDPQYVVGLVADLLGSPARSSTQLAR
jgi:very-short-patch-repair endonuclease